MTEVLQFTASDYPFDQYLPVFLVFIYFLSIVPNFIRIVQVKANSQNNTNHFFVRGKSSTSEHKQTIIRSLVVRDCGRKSPSSPLCNLFKFGFIWKYINIVCLLNFMMVTDNKSQILE
jgi:hypothetical protein